MEREYQDTEDFLRKVGEGRIVFIGGDYDHMALLDFIRGIVEDLKRPFKLYPIIAYQIKIPFQEIHRQDMILLSRSNFAIFEISSPAGQLLELERAKRLIEEEKDFKLGIYFQGRGPKEVLVDDILDSEKFPGQVTSMITGFLDFWKNGKVHISGYENLSQLRRLISDLLRG